MIEAGFEYFGGGSIAGYVPTKLSMSSVCPHDHDLGVPAHHRGQSLLEFQIAGIGNLVLKGDRVSIRSVGRGGGREAPLLRVLGQPPQNE
jgi:hypothetical protein